MEDVIELYGKPFNAKEPVICFDEKSKQLMEDFRKGKGIMPGKTAVRDYEYVRKGTANIFIAVEPKAGRRFTEVTERRTKKDYASFLQKLIDQWPQAEHIHLVQDNLNIHQEKSLILAVGKTKTSKLMRKVKFHFTPNHASWLNMAEIEIGVLARQCLKRRIPNLNYLKREVRAWEWQSNKAKRKITWNFTPQKARTTFSALYHTELKK